MHDSFANSCCNDLCKSIFSCLNFEPSSLKVLIPHAAVCRRRCLFFPLYLTLLKYKNIDSWLVHRVMCAGTRSDIQGWLVVSWASAAVFAVCSGVTEALRWLEETHSIRSVSILLSSLGLAFQIFTVWYVIEPNLIYHYISYHDKKSWLWTVESDTLQTVSA